MELMPTTTATAAVKSPQTETETPPKIQPTKAVPFSNGVLKRRHHHHHAPPQVLYKECLKNHAATLGGHALDGCGEFFPSPAATADPTSLKCAACGCHRNFHRRESDEPLSSPAIEYQPLHRHHAPPHPVSNRSPSSASPPPISSAYYPSAPHILLALSGGLPENAVPSVTPNSRKRFRTKFTQEQKEKMFGFAERVGWKMQKRDEDLVREFCSDIGVEKGVLKVWMHNNKNTLGKKEQIAGDDEKINGQNDVGEAIAAANGSSSSS